MVRRGYKITVAQDDEISKLASAAKVDKEQIVQSGLQFGLPEVRRRWEAAGKPQGLEFFRAVLIGDDDRRIKKSR